MPILIFLGPSIGFVGGGTIACLASEKMFSTTERLQKNQQDTEEKIKLLIMNVKQKRTEEGIEFVDLKK